MEIKNFKSPIFLASAVLFISFFLPWFKFGQISIHGYDLEMLAEFENKAEALKNNPLLNIVYLIPIFSLVTLYISIFKAEILLKKIASIIFIVPTAIIIYLAFQTEMGFDTADWSNISIGYFITVLSTAVLLFYGIRKLFK